MSFATRVALLMLPLLFGVPAQAQEVEVGASLICDTQEQMPPSTTRPLAPSPLWPTCAGPSSPLPEAKTRPLKSSESWFSASSPRRASNP